MYIPPGLKEITPQFADPLTLVKENVAQRKRGVNIHTHTFLYIDIDIDIDIDR